MLRPKTTLEERTGSSRQHGRTEASSSQRINMAVDSTPHPIGEDGSHEFTLSVGSSSRISRLGLWAGRNQILRDFENRCPE